MAALAGIAKVILTGAPAPAQVSGAFGGREARTRSELARLSPEDAGSFISIAGSCELRLPADGLRVVFAIATEAATPTECWEQQRVRRATFVAALADAGIHRESVQADFISMLPVYEWKQEAREREAVLVEQLAGHRLQENVHVAVADEEGARPVIELALANGVHDVIAVEYWSNATPARRREALEAALGAAKSKADLLLAGFATRPLLANIEESTDVLSPDELYQSFESVYAGSVETAWRNDVPRVHAFRPKNTFFAGFDGDVDQGATTPRMRPEISVVSTVVLYFESPAHPRTPPANGAERR